MRDKYIEQVFMRLQAHPTTADLDYLVEAYTRIGYLAAEAEGLYEEAVDRRKHAEANAYLEAKTGGEKVSDKQAEAMAAVKCWEYRTAETEAKVKAAKIRNLLESIEQAINAIKFLGRYDAPVNMPEK